MIDDVFAARFIALRDDLPSAGGLLGHRHRAARPGAVAALRAAGWRGGAWDTLLRVGAAACCPIRRRSHWRRCSSPPARPGRPRAWRCRTRRCTSSAPIIVALTRLTDARHLPDGDAAVPRQRAVHGRLPGPDRRRPVVIRSRFSASRWVDQLRENHVTVTNLIGVMMDFVWKQPPRAERRRQRAALRVRGADGLLDPARVHGAVRHRGVRRRVRADRDVRADHGPVRRDPAGRGAGLLAADWFEIRLVDPETDREVPVGRSASSSCATSTRGRAAWATTACRRRPSRRGGTCGSTPATRCAGTTTGWYYFVDRYKDALRRRGENISSYEVEQAILGHPAVAECAVIGVPADVEAGEDEVLAVVVPAGDVDAAAIWAVVPGQIPGFAIPRFVRFVERAAADAVGEDPQGGAARQRSDRGHPRPDGVGRPRAGPTRCPRSPSSPLGPRALALRRLCIAAGHFFDFADRPNIFRPLKRFILRLIQRPLETRWSRRSLSGARGREPPEPSPERASAPRAQGVRLGGGGFA